MQIRPEFIRSLPGDPKELSVQRNYFSRWHIDFPLLILIFLLAAYCLTVLYSASGGSFDRVLRQFIYFMVALVAMLVVAQVRVKTIMNLSPLVFLIALFLLVLVPFFGVGAKGAQRWLSVFGFFRFQPSEIMKIVLPLTVAWYLKDKILPPRMSYLLVSLFIVAIPTALIVIQPDLGTSLLIASSGLFVIWLAGIKWRYLISASFVSVLSIWPVWRYMMHDYQRQRVITLFNPESDRLGAGWNIIQSKTAIGSGGLDGKGWLNGTQSHLDFLPEGHTDFIIAVLAEEFGFIGVLALIVLYTLVIFRGAYISVRAKNTFSRLVAGSITLTFFVYIVVNMGMVSGLLPVVGVPLPLMSYGGTALVTMLANFGILMAISTEEK